MTMTEEGPQTAVVDSTAASTTEQTRSFKARAIRASAVTIGGYGASQILRIGGNMALTRLLFPEAFGLMALVQVILTGLEMISDIGIQPSIVQNRRGDDPAFLNTAWTIQIIRGFILWVCGLVIAVLFVWLYDQPQLLQLVPVTATAAVLAGFNSTKLATLNRRMIVAPAILIDLTAQVTAIVVMISTALVYRSVWALVAGGIAFPLIKMALSHLVLSGIRNRFCWEAEASREIIRYGKWILVSTLVTFLALRLDILLLGRLLPLELLGIYSIAGLLAVLPQQIAGRLMVWVLFPALAAAERESRERFSARLRRVRSILLPAAALTVLSIALLAPAFFRYLYDERYHSAGWMAQLLMVSVWFQLLHTIAVRIVLALGDSRSLAMSNVLRLLFTATGCLVGFNLAGLIGFILGAGIGSLTGYLALVVVMLRHRLPIGWDDLRYSLSAGACALIGIFGPKILAPMLELEEVGLLEFGFAGLILGPAGFFVANRARRLSRA